MVGAVSAQKAFFPIKKGTVLTYVHKNASGKPESYHSMKIEDIQGNESDFTVSYLFTVMDKDKKPVGEPMPCKVGIQGDVVTFDLHQMMGNMQQMPVQMEITGVPMQLSANMKEGDAIKDADVTMSADMGIAKMKTTVQMTGGKCVAIEDLAVPAGTFRCHKISQDVSTKVLGRSVSMKSVSWYAVGVGTIRSETFNEKGKITETTELLNME